MNARLKSVVAVACLTLVVVALLACSSEPTPPPDPEPAPAAEESTAAPEPRSAPAAAAEDEESTADAAPEAATEEEQEEPPADAAPEAAPEEEEPPAEPEPADTPEPAEEESAADPETEAAPEAEESAPAATDAAVVATPDGPLPFDPAVVRGALSNGLVYYIRHNEEPPGRGQLSLVVKAGSVFEEDEQRGLAHFVEHMAFNGTARFAKQQIIDYLESIGSSLGADINAQTGYDHTLYFLEIPTDDPEILETAFQILSDWAYAISFDPDEVELERGVVLEEWRLYQGFSSRFQTNLLPLLFGASRYTDRSPIGLPEILETAPVEQLRAYYERWYRPDLMAVVAVGDFDPALIEAKISQHFAPPPEGEATAERAAVADPTDRPSFAIPDNDAARIDVFTDPEAPGAQLILVRKVTPEAGRDVAAFRRATVEQLAFMMLNARLFERGQDADPPWLWSGAGRSGMVEPLDIQTFTIVVEQAGVERGFTALLEELQRVRQHGFTDSELAREKVNLLSSVEREYTQRDQRRSGQLANRYADHFLIGTPVPGIEAEWELYQALLPQVSLAEIDALADSWSQPGNTVLLVLGPEGIDPDGDGALAAALQTQLDEADTLAVTAYEDTFDDVPLLATLPTPGSIVEEESLESIDAVRWTLSNGITVIAKQTDFRDDEVRFSGYSPGGHSLVSDADHVSAQHAAELVAGSGVGLHDSVTLEKLLAGKRVSVGPYIGELFEGLDGSASPQDLESLFQLITLYATAPRLDPDYFSTYEARLRSVAEVRPTQPDAVLFDTANTLLSQQHLRRRPLSLALIEELSLERAEAVYADRFADLGDATFVFVGAFDWDDLRSLTATYLASLPSAGRAEQWRDVGVDPPDGVVEQVVRSGIEPRSATVWVFAGDAEWSREEALALEVAGEMLGIRLRERVREELGGTYSIQVSASARLLPDHEYQVAIIFGSDPSRAEELADEVAVELDWLRAGGDQGDLDTVKELLRTTREEQVRDNGFWLGQIRAATQRGESLTEIGRFDERLEALTLEQVVAAARRYLPTDRYVRVVLLPEDE